MIKALDVSSYQPKDLTPLIKRHDPDLVIVKLYMSWESVDVGHTLAQAQSAKFNDTEVGGYVWCYHSTSPEDTIAEAISVARTAGISLPDQVFSPKDILWLDCESYGSSTGSDFDRGPDTEWLRRALDEAGLYKVTLGIYTGQWWWLKYMQGVTEFANMPLWCANYSVDDIADLPLFGGWTHESGNVVGLQYTSDPVDMSMFHKLDYGYGEPVPTMSEVEKALHAMWSDISHMQKLLEETKQHIVAIKEDQGIK